MDDALIALGRRAVACPGFRELPGIRRLPVGDDGAAWPQRYVAQAEGVFVVGKLGRTMFRASRADEDRAAEWVLDLSDPAALGCLLALVREAWGRPDLTTRANRACTEWVIDAVGPPDALLAIVGTTEAEALVDALEAAAGRRA